MGTYVLSMSELRPVVTKRTMQRLNRLCEDPSTSTDAKINSILDKLQQRNPRSLDDQETEPEIEVDVEEEPEETGEETSHG